MHQAWGVGGGERGAGAGLVPNINTCVEAPGKSSPAHPAGTLLSAGVWRGSGAGVPGTGWPWFPVSTASREPPAAHCRSDDTQGPPGWWGLPGSPSQCWGSHTSTPHAAHSETSCTEEREKGPCWTPPPSRNPTVCTGQRCRPACAKEELLCSGPEFGVANKLQCHTGTADTGTTL